MVGDVKIIMDKRAELQVNDEEMTDWGMIFYRMEVKE